jgi:two-component system, cell cycle response regulator
MENNVLKIIEESGSKGPKYESLVKIFKLLNFRR